MKQWVGLGKFLAGHMQVIVPFCVALGVLFPQQIGVLKPIVPTLFAFMTFQGALSNTFHQVTEVFRRPLHLVLALLVSAVLIPIAAYAMGSILTLRPLSLMALTKPSLAASSAECSVSCRTPMV